MTVEAQVARESRSRELLLCAGAGLLSGLLLFNSDYPINLWPMMALAFMPLLAVLARRRSRVASAALAGVGLSLGYLIPLVVILRFPISMSLFFIAYYGLFWVLFALLGHALWRRPGVMAALATGALAGLVDYATYSVVPIWGTAQSLGKTWIDWPWGVGFVAFTGLAGVVAVLVALQSLAMLAIRRPEAKAGAGIAALSLMGVVAAANFWVSPGEPEGSVRVAALTILEPRTDDDRPMPALANIESHIRPMVAEAVEGGAEIVATPEYSLRVEAEDRDATLEALTSLAREHKIWLFAGLFDNVDEKNRLLFIDPEGRTVASYEKVHLIYQLESYNPGDGTLALVTAAGGLWGGMICQDDNFPEPAASYAAAGVQAMVVPTFDWREVKDFHFESSRFRSVEYRYAILRSAMNGISAIVAPGGRVVAMRDAYTDGEGVLVGDLPLPAADEVRARIRAWFLVACGLLVVGATHPGNFLKTWRARRQGGRRSAPVANGVRRDC